MDMNIGHAIIVAKRPILRRVFYGFMGLFGLVVGWGIGIGALIRHRGNPPTIAIPLIIIGFLLPFILVGGHMLRYRAGAKQIRSVFCRKCDSEFALRDMYKAGGCPECGSKKSE